MTSGILKFTKKFVKIQIHAKFVVSGPHTASPNVLESHADNFSGERTFWPMLNVLLIYVRGGPFIPAKLRLYDWSESLNRLIKSTGQNISR